MSYLNREDRRAMILNAAKELVLKEGILALTARKLSTYAQVSVGQIHHHFSSLIALKTEVFLSLMDHINDINRLSQTDDWQEKLYLLLGLGNPEALKPYLKIYNEVLVLMDKDEAYKVAFGLATQRWHDSLTHLIHEGQEQGAIQVDPNKNIADIAWRLIALIVGLDSLLSLNNYSKTAALAISQDNANRYIEQLIAYEFTDLE
ncbi:MAG: TetR family transcriptional regulator [Pelistega sp.]|nr:TetR family transcriptional regulator [Pelistega sp.]